MLGGEKLSISLSRSSTDYVNWASVLRFIKKATSSCFPLRFLVWPLLPNQGLQYLSSHLRERPESFLEVSSGNRFLFSFTTESVLSFFELCAQDHRLLRWCVLGSTDNCRGQVADIGETEGENVGFCCLSLASFRLFSELSIRGSSSPSRP